jgi:hypothetical protein
LPSALFNTTLPPTRRKSPHTKPNAAGMQECNRSAQSKKKTVLPLNKRKKLKKDAIFVYNF